MQYASLAMVVLTLGVAAIVVAIGWTRLQYAEVQPLRHWVRWANSPQFRSSDEFAKQAVAIDLTHQDAQRLIWMAGGAAIGALFGATVVLAMEHTLVLEDPAAAAIPMFSIVAGLYLGGIGYALLAVQWFRTHPGTRSRALVRALLPLVPSFLTVSTLGTVTAARSLGRLATYAGAAYTQHFASMSYLHPWTIWLLPGVLTTMFAFQAALTLRLYASVPVFTSTDHRLLLAAGQQSRSWAYGMTALTSMIIGVLAVQQFDLLQLSDINLTLWLSLASFVLGVGGMYLTLFLRTPADHAVEPALQQS